MIRDGYMAVLADHSTDKGGEVRLYVHEINFYHNYKTT
jgi:hypothetical protein